MHLTSGKENSANLALTEFSEVRVYLSASLWLGYPGTDLDKGRLWAVLIRRSDPPQQSRSFVAQAGVSTLILRISVSSVLVRTLCLILVAANHGRSLHRARLSRHLPDLTLYESPLLASLRELPIEPLKALLLCVQLAR